MDLILKHRVKDGSEGVSFIGGELILQEEGFAALAQKCQEEELSVLLFTCFSYDDLLTMKNIDIDILLNNSDAIVDGEFVESLYDKERDWVGSSNQRVIFLSDRYYDGIEYEHGTHSTEIRILKNRIGINGWSLRIN